MNATSADAPHRWSAEVTEHGHAVDLEPGLFDSDDPTKIALALKRSVEARQRSDPYRSAMSMLDFYINRAGSHLPPARREVLEAAKGALRTAFGREPD